MTRIAQTEISCPCGNRFDATYYASINTFLGGEGLIERLLNGTLYNFQCKKCGKIIHLSTKIIISSISGMITISTGLDPESIREILIRRGFIDSDGNILYGIGSPFIKDPPKGTPPVSKEMRQQIRSELKEIFRKEDENHENKPKKIDEDNKKD